jgi:glutathione S-transferase
LGLDSVNTKSAKGVQEAATIIAENAGKVPTIVVDDFSLLVESTVTDLEKVHSFGDMWRKLRQQVLFVRDSARYATSKGTHVFFNCHQVPPKVSSGKQVRGGPKLPGQLPEQFSAFADVVARAEYEETAAPWKYVLRTGPNPDYIAGDRLGVLPDPAPMNLREALIAAGYDLPRPKGLEWMDKMADKLSALVLKNGLEEWRNVLSEAGKTLASKHDLRHVRWVLQDSLHRAVIQNAGENILDRMFIDEQEQW